MDKKKSLNRKKKGLMYYSTYHGRVFSPVKTKVAEKEVMDEWMDGWESFEPAGLH